MTDIGQETAAPAPVWGLWATLGWVILALLLSQAIGAVVLILLRPDAITGDMDVLLKDGVAVSLSNIPANAVQVIVLALASRRRDWSFTEYLGLVRPATRDVVAALWILLI